MLRTPVKRVKKPKISSKRDDQLVTRKFVRLVWDELKYDIRTQGLKFESRFKSIDARFNEVDARFDKVDAQFAELKSEMQAMRSENSRMLALFEEQAHSNRIVLEGYQMLWEKMDRIEASKSV